MRLWLRGHSNSADVSERGEKSLKGVQNSAQERGIGSKTDNWENSHALTRKSFEQEH